MKRKDILLRCIHCLSFVGLHITFKVFVFENEEDVVHPIHLCAHYSLSLRLSYLDRPKYISGEFGRIFRAQIPSARNVPEIYFGRFKGNLYVIRANSGAFRANLGTFRANSGDFGQIRANSGAQPVSYVCWEACYQCKNLTLYLKDWHKICSKKKKLSKNS